MKFAPFVTLLNIRVGDLNIINNNFLFNLLKCIVNYSLIKCAYQYVLVIHFKKIAKIEKKKVAYSNFRYIVYN